jgi:hypothetical protein
VQDSGFLFEGEDLDDTSAPACLASLPYGGVLETSRALGIEGRSAEQLSRSGFFTILNLGPGVAKPQTSYHLSQLSEVIAAAEKMRLPDFYVSNALYASKRSRQISNVKSLQVAWVDLDCYNQGIDPTPDFVEKLIARACFAGIPSPSHVVSSGRGLYLKWLLDKPVPDSLLPAWNQVQRALSQLYVDLGADIKSTDAARVLRVVNTMNPKVAAAGRHGGLVGVVWDGGQRHSFESLWQAINLLDLQTTAALKKAGAKVAHLAGRGGPTPDFALPPGARGDLSFLKEFGTTRLPRLDLEAKARAEGKGNGFSGVSLAWNRFLDLRDLMQRRAEAAGRTGVQEGSRDLTMLWMVNFLAQARVVNSSNVFREIDGLMRAFDGADLPGPRGYEHPEKSGALNTLVNRIKASEAGRQVRHGGGMWDPKYTPTNDYLINVFGITSDEMRDMRTLIDQDEKRARADRRVEGRAERRASRHSWNDQALRLRAERLAALESGDMSVPEPKVCAWIAGQLELSTDQVRKFLRRHDDKTKLAEARKRGDAPRRAYRKPADLSPAELETRNRINAKRKQQRYIESLRKDGYEGDGSTESVQAWLEEKTEAFARNNEKVAAAAVDQAREAEASSLRGMNVTLERLLRKATADAGARDAVDRLAVSGAASAQETITRASSQLRDNLAKQVHTMNPLPTEQSNTGETANALPSKGIASKRSLLNKARKAQNKAPLPESANDPVIDRVAAEAADDQEAAPVELEAASPLATGVIPPDLMDSWSGAPMDDSEPAGMPDLDDGYLDSLADASLPAGAQLPGSSGDAVQPAERQTARAATLAFARPASPGPTNPAPARGFGFNLAASTPAPVRANTSSSASPAAAAAPVRGFVPVRRAAASPAQPLGFGSPARLSTEQARVNGQHQDFTKLFDEPRYDADGTPATYPKPEVWPHDDIPAGSRYSREEWKDARTPDESMPTGHVVVELQIGNPVTSALIKVPRKAPTEVSAPPVARTRVVDGKVVKLAPYQGIDDPLADAIADTIVVSRKSPIPAEVRGAVEGGIEVNRGGVSSYFRFIRPRDHYKDADKFLYINSKLQMTGSFGEAGARMAVPLDSPSGAHEAPAERGYEEEQDPAEAPRG